jgi:hypothetical protein
VYVKSALAGSNYFCGTYNGFSNRPVVEFAWNIARSCDDDSQTLGTLREKGRESAARRWRTLCVIALSLSVAVPFVGDVYGAETGD